MKKETGDQLRKGEASALHRMDDGKMTRKDSWICVALTAAYLLVSLLNLGSLHQPRTGWIPPETGIVFRVEFAEPVALSRITYLSGHGNSWNIASNLSVRYLDEDGSYRDLVHLPISPYEFMKWYHVDVNAVTRELEFVTGNYVSPEQVNYGFRGQYREIAFFRKDSREPVQVSRVVFPEEHPGIPALFDESAWAVYHPNIQNSTYFDEIYFVRTAYEYLEGLSIFENTHPPLGKLLQVPGIALLGLTPFGWRITGTLAGAMMIPALYLFAKRLFKNTFLALTAGLLLAFDFMLFVQTRIGTVDGYLVLAMLLMFYFMHEFTRAPLPEERKPYVSLIPLMLSGVMLGLAVSVKWIGLFAGAGIAFLYFHSRRKVWMQHRKRRKKKQIFLRHILFPSGMCLVFFVAIPLLIYFLSFIPVFLSEGSTNWILDFLRYQRHMFAYHSSVNVTHAFASPWWTWPLMIRPVFLYSSPAAAEGMRGSIVSMGNPAIWWGGLPILIAGAIKAWKNRDSRIAVILAGYLSIWLPWAVSPRDTTFLYHYFGSVPFLILGIVLFFEYLLRDNPKNRRLIWGYLGVSAGLFVIFYPVLSGMHVPEWYVAALRWLPSWWF